MPDLILASTSPWRQRMLENAGIRVHAEAPGVDERAVEGDDPVDLARVLAEQKASAIAARHADACVLGADQVLWDGERIGGKPEDAGEHLAMLRSMRGRSHELITGYALIAPGWRHVGHVATTMHVRSDLEDDELERYVATGEGSRCAGGYAIEGRGAFLFERIDGDWFNVVGLPLLEVIAVLRAHGWRFDGEGG